MPDQEVRSRMVSTNGVDLHVVEAGGEGPVVLLAHGFPELAYSWRHQLPALAEAGYRAVAPDQRGYGRSSRPDAIEDYDIHHLTGDLVGLLDDLEAAQAVVVGHDWGSMVASYLALLHPERVRRLVNMSVPHLPRGARRRSRRCATPSATCSSTSSTSRSRASPTPSWAATPPARCAGCSPAPPGPDAPPDPAWFANDGRGFVERMPEPDGLPGWLSGAELDHYVEEFRRTGFTGGLNWYRNFDRNWETTAELAGATVPVPSLFVGGALDLVLRMSPPGSAHGALADHRGDVVVPGAGHWVQQEAPAAVNAALVGFLDDVCPEKASGRVALSRDIDAFRAEAVAFLTGAQAAGTACPAYGAIVPPALHNQARAWQRQLAAAGFAGLHWPVDYGGRGLGRAHTAVWLEECARAQVSPYLNLQGLVLAGEAILRSGTDEQRRRFLPPTLTGELLWCQLFSEPGAGSDLTGLTTAAVADGDRYVIDGTKIWSSNAQHAEYGILLARTDAQQRGHRGISFFLLDMATPGVAVRPIRQMTGDQEFCEVFLDGVAVPAEARLGPENDGWRVATEVLLDERGSSGAGLVSLERRLDHLRSLAGDDPVRRDALLRLYGRGQALRGSSCGAVPAAQRPPRPPS